MVAPPESLVLSEADRAELQAKSVRGLVRVVWLQGVAVLVAVLLCWVLFSWRAGASALAGGGAYYLPNALFALYLAVRMLGGRPMGPAGFLVGELAKLGAAALLLAWAAYAWQAWLVWPALLFGLVCVLKGYLVLLFLGKLS
jgi:ATP synthase protein I